MFQFLSGSIKRRHYRVVLKKEKSSFNSFPVRLKETKEVIATIKRIGQFQFLSGSIKS